MLTDVAAVVASIAVVVGLCWALHGWFTLSINRFNSVAAKDVLALGMPSWRRSRQTTVNGCARSHRWRSWKPL
jgi:hypothetical protein